MIHHEGTKDTKASLTESVSKVLPIHKAQVLTYLKLVKLNLGLIINFNVDMLRLGIHRIVMG